MRLYFLLDLGYYKVNYDNNTWDKIISALNSSEDRKIIPVANRAALIDDLMSLGFAGLLDYRIVFSGLKYLAQETNYIPWKSLYDNIIDLIHLCNSRPEMYEFKVSILNVQKSSFLQKSLFYVFLMTFRMIFFFFFSFIQRFIVNLLQPNFKRLGFKYQSNDSENDVVLRRTVLSVLCYLEYNDCVK